MERNTKWKKIESEKSGMGGKRVGDVEDYDVPWKSLAVLGLALVFVRLG